MRYNSATNVDRKVVRKASSYLIIHGMNLRFTLWRKQSQKRTLFNFHENAIDPIPFFIVFYAVVKLTKHILFTPSCKWIKMCFEKKNYSNGQRLSFGGRNPPFFPHSFHKMFSVNANQANQRKCEII